MEVVGLPPKITYFPDFITSDEEEQLLRNIYDSPKSKWTQLSNRRLQNWGGLPHVKGMIQEPLPAWLQTYMNKISEVTGAFGAVRPNHCLVNEYKPGQGIMPHEDGDMFYPTVSTITIGSHGVLDFYKHINELGETTDPQESGATSLEDRHVGSILLERCSLVLVQESMYTSYLHGIKEVACDTLTQSIANISSTKKSVGEELVRATRVSLTVRHVNKTVSAKKISSLFGKQRK